MVAVSAAVEDNGLDASALGTCGHELTHLTHQSVQDVEWLELCGREDWPALTMDRRIRYRPTEIAAVRRHRVKAFALTSGNLTAPEQAERFVRNSRRIEIACAQPGPFLYAVHATQIVRIFP